MSKVSRQSYQHKYGQHSLIVGLSSSTLLSFRYMKTMNNLNRGAKLMSDRVGHETYAIASSLSCNMSNCIRVTE